MTIGILVGSGPFVRHVRHDLVSSEIPHEFFSFVEEEGPDFPCCPIEYKDRQGAARTIREKGVDRLFHAGTFTRLREKVRLLSAKADATQEAPHEPSARQILVEWERTLRNAGVEPIWVWEVLPNYRAGTGVLGGLPVSAGPFASDFDAITATIRAHVDQVTADIRYGVSHAVVLAGDHILATETLEGTDGLLRDVRDSHPSNGDVRTLVKVCTPGSPVKLDPPTIGKHTIELAAETGISVIAIEGERGVIVDRQGVIEFADRKGIALIGI
jgi:DUF1009 family protein